MPNKSKLYTVRKEGGSRVMAVTGLIPENWKFVDIEIKRQSAETVLVYIRKVK